MFYRSLVSLSVLVSSSAFAASPVAMTCNIDEKTGKPDFMVRLEKNGTTTWESVGYHDDHYADSYAIAGKAEQPSYDDDNKKVMTNQVAFVSQGKGKYEMNSLHLLPGTPKEIPGYYRNARGQGRLACIPGPAYEAFAKAMEKSKTLTTEEFDNAEDTSLAAVCRVNGTTKTSHQLRTTGDGFGRVSMQVRDLSKEWGMDSYDVLTFGAPGVLVFKNDKSMRIRHDSQKLARMYLETATKKNSAGKKTHRVVLVEDLKTPEKAPVEIVCEEAQRYSEIARYATEAKMMPKAFPKKPGTRAQIDKKLCGRDQYEAARQRLDMYSSLVMEMPLPKGMDTTMLSMGRKGKEECPTFEIGVSTRATAEYMRKILGESLNGLEVTFEIGEDSEDAEVATATAG